MLPELEQPAQPELEANEPRLFRRGDGPLIALLLAIPLVLSLPVLGTPLHGPVLDLLGEGGAATSLAGVSDAIARYPHAPLSWVVMALVWEFFPGAFTQHLLPPLLQGVGAVLLFLTATQIAEVTWPAREALEVRRIPLGRAALAALAAIYAVNDIVVTAAAYPLLLPVPLGGALAIAALLCWTLALRRDRPWTWAALGLLLYALACGANLPVVLLPLAGLPLAYRVRASLHTATITLAPPCLLAGIILAVVLGEGAGARQPLWDAVSPFLAVPFRGLIGGTMLPERFGTLPVVPGTLVATQPLLLAAFMALALIPEKGVLRGGVLQVACAVVFGGLAVGFAALSWMKAGMAANPERVWAIEAEKAADPAQRDAAVLHLLEYTLGRAASLEDPQTREASLRHSIPLLDALLEREPLDAEALSLGARAAMLQSELDAASDLARRAAAADPFSPEAAGLVAMAATLRTPQPRTLEEARAVAAACRRAEFHDALPEEARLPYAAALGLLGDFSGAMRQVNALPSALRGQAGPLVEQLRMGARTADNAAQQFAQVSAQDPASSQRFVAEAQAALAVRDYLRAYYRLERLLSREPSNKRAFELMAMTLAGMEDPESFVSQWGALHADDGETWARTVVAAVSLGKTEAALLYAEHAAQGLGPAWGAVQSGRALMSAGRMDEARARLESATGDGAFAGPAWIALAELHLRRGDASAAGTALENARLAGAPEEALAPLRQALQGR